MDFSLIIVAIVVILIVVVLVGIFGGDQSRSSLKSAHNGKTPDVIPASKLPGHKNSNDYTWSFWIYVNNWNYNYGTKKVIIKRSGEGGLSCPEIYLDENKNDLLVDISTYDPTGTSNDSAKVTTKVRNIPLQKWTYVVITTSGLSVDVYLDGKLRRTSLLPNPAKIVANADIELCPKVDSNNPGFSGFLSKINYFARSVNPREVYSMYKGGFSPGWGSSLMNRFKFRFQFEKDGEEISSFAI